MATQDDDNQDRSEDSDDESTESTEQSAETSESRREAESDAADPVLAPAQLGTAKYVHAAFFAAGILVAFVSGKILLAAWNRLSEWETAVHAVPQLLSFPEDERDSLMMVTGAVIGLVTVIQAYRKEGVRRWADEVAGELGKVTWPDKELVTNGTLVVIVASMIATVYVALLDQFWQFLTQLIYGT